MADLAITTGLSLNIVHSEKADVKDFIQAATLAVADVIYQNSSGYADKADANVSGKTGVRGIVVRKTGSVISALRRGYLAGYDLSGLSYDDPVYLSATAGKLADTNPAANEQQTVTITGSPTGGTFTLTYAGATTAAIAFNAAASAVQAALEALATIGLGNVIVSGSAGGPYTVEFISELGEMPLAAMTADGALLTGGTTPAVAVAEATSGVTGLVVGRVCGLTDPGLEKILWFDADWL